MAEARTCPVCGETAPTAWICVTRLAGVAKPGEPCGYSVEGDARGNERLNAAIEKFGAALLTQAEAPSTGAGGKDA